MKSSPPETSNNRDAPSAPETLRATTQPNQKRNPFEISNSNRLEAFSPRDSPNDQSLQQAVDQFLCMDNPTTGFHSSVSPSPPLSHSIVTLMPTNPVSLESTLPLTKTTIPPPIITTSVITHTDKGKGIAEPTSIHPSPPRTGPPGNVIYEPVSLTSPTSSPGPRRSSTRQSNQDYREAQHIHSPDPTTSTPQQLRHPELIQQDTPALFVDAALDQDRGVTGIGCVLKIGLHQVIATTNSHKPGAPPPIFAEAQALAHGCLNLVSKVNGNWQDNSTLALIVKQIRQSFSNFPDASLVHLPREFNTTTHFLAREAIRL
ncbi:hypothetical protein F8388_011179 [Cannabis sativa]|uniref:RNase H type-1 domain-containing protein n=1 Tax=Cannabis sativa TaxID=3483 RepID=A0A7J6EGE5_CANSA|nr:hypothetical protein F8388_011179 [Cannabis sativa]